MDALWAILLLFSVSLALSLALSGFPLSLSVALSPPLGHDVKLSLRIGTSTEEKEIGEKITLRRLCSSSF